MKSASDDLERLISRYLDDECTSSERRELKAALRSDPAAEALFDEHAAIDREVGYALRRALGRTLWPGEPRRGWSRVGGVLAVAAAACLAVVVWLGSPKAVDRQSAADGEARAGSWFAPPVWQDGLEAESRAYEEPHVGLRGTERDWILIPGEGPGEYLVVEVDRVQVRLIPIREDF